jgi:hypothetical protein
LKKGESHLGKKYYSNILHIFFLSSIVTTINRTIIIIQLIRAEVQFNDAMVTQKKTEELETEISKQNRERALSISPIHPNCSCVIYLILI